MKKQRRSSFSLLKKFLSVVLLTPVVIFSLIFLLTLSGVFGPVPGTKELSKLNLDKATVLISSDGIQMGSFRDQNRTYVSLDEVSPNMVDALLAIEDIRFRSHSGVDYRALARVFVKTILMGQNTGGGSTLTQQLAKNLYPREGNGGLMLITDKLREMIIAKRIESVYTKNEILELYLNYISFGEDTFGIEMASHRFFSKSSSELNLNEAATLAGVLKATTYYNPHQNPERARNRRNLVLMQMEKYGMIESDQVSDWLKKELSVDYDRSSGVQDIAPYFKVQIQKELKSILDTLTAQPDLGSDLSNSGLTVHTSLDTRIQQAAEQAVKNQMKQLQAIFDREIENRPIFGEEDSEVLRVWRQSESYQRLQAEGISEDEIAEILHDPVPSLLYSWDGYREIEISPYDEIRYYLSFLNAGFYAIHPTNGHVLAWVGGIDYRHFPYDQVQAYRQPGSAFKPILYAAAIESGRRPCDYQRNILAQYAEYDNWTPQNNNQEYGGRYSLQAALAQSVNTVAVQLATETGIESIRTTAQKFGLNSQLPDGPSVALGTAEMSLMELTTAYTAFLNEGKPIEPIFITEIYTDGGERIYHADDKSSDSNRIQLPVSGEVRIETPLSSNSLDGISDETASTIVKMLEKTINEGTGEPLRTRFQINHALAGKTGTTQNFTDGWFIGFTPSLVFGTRVGGWNHRVRFREFPAYASQTALPIAGAFLQNMALNHDLPAAAHAFRPDQIDTPYSLTCSDTRNDKLTDRIRDFFTGKSSDEPRVIGETDESNEKKGNIFKRIGRKLGITKDKDN